MLITIYNALMDIDDTLVEAPDKWIDFTGRRFFEFDLIPYS